MKTPDGYNSDDEFTCKALMSSSGSGGSAPLGVKLASVDWTGVVGSAGLAGLAAKPFLLLLLSWSGFEADFEEVSRTKTPPIVDYSASLRFVDYFFLTIMWTSQG